MVPGAAAAAAGAAASAELDGNRLVLPLKQALGLLQQDEVLLAETVRQRRGERTFPQRAVNTAMLSMRLGLEIEYDEHRILSLGLCALMHDLGMLGLPAELLEARRLTPEQCDLLQRHPLESQRLAQAFGKGFAWIGRIVTQGHERSDGTVYPAGLKGERIHELARIIGLADTYGAMVHPRSDRQVRAVYHVVEEIIHLRNTLFDGHLVKALIHIVSIFPWAAWSSSTTRRSGGWWVPAGCTPPGRRWRSCLMRGAGASIPRALSCWRRSRWSTSWIRPSRKAYSTNRDGPCWADYSTN